MPPMLTISNLPLSNNRTSSGFSNRFKMTSSMAHLRLQWFSLRAVYQPSPDGSKLVGPLAIRHVAQFKLVRVNDDVFDALALPGVSDMHQPVCSLDHCRI